MTKATGSWYTVQKNDGAVIDCKLKGKLRNEGLRSTSPVAVGDHVLLQENTINAIQPRRNCIIRRSAKLSAQSHIIAANIDAAILVVTHRLPQTPAAFIDRFLVSAAAYQIPVHLIFNKIDFLTEQELAQLRQFASIYSAIGHQVLETSATDLTGIVPLRQMLSGQVSVIAGLSGTGKSSLINAIDPVLHARIGAMSDYHQTGRHTTTFAEMHPLQTGGYIIDTPGIRGFGLIHIEKEELAHYFPEMFRLAPHCAYYNCRHLSEPGCAVTEAVAAGAVSESRYRSYLNMMDDVHRKHR